MKHQISNGFTFIELLIALTVAAIMLSIAIPNYNTLMMNKRITTQANSFLSSVALARSEALKRVDRVTVCKSSDGQICTTTGGWEQGWIVFVDSNSSGTVNTGEDVLRVVSQLAGGNTLRGSDDVDDFITYVQTGHTQSFQAGTFALCDSRGAGNHARELSLSATGRLRVVTDTAPVSCSPS